MKVLFSQRRAFRRQTSADAVFALGETIFREDQKSVRESEPGLESGGRDALADITAKVKLQCVHR
jgi:hypothetical protein